MGIWVLPPTCMGLSLLGLPLACLHVVNHKSNHQSPITVGYVRGWNHFVRKFASDMFPLEKNSTQRYFQIFIFYKTKIYIKISSESELDIVSTFKNKGRHASQVSKFIVLLVANCLYSYLITLCVYQ